MRETTQYYLRISSKSMRQEGLLEGERMATQFAEEKRFFREDWVWDEDFVA